MANAAVMCSQLRNQRIRQGRVVDAKAKKKEAEIRPGFGCIGVIHVSKIRHACIVGRMAWFLPVTLRVAEKPLRRCALVRTVAV